MNTPKTNNIFAWQSKETAKSAFLTPSYCAILGGRIMNFDVKQNDEYPLKN